MVPNNGESNEKKTENEMEAGIILVSILYYSYRIFIWGYYGTHYRVRSYPPFGGIVC